MEITNKLAFSCLIPFVAFLQMLHQHGHHNIDQHKLGDEHEYHEKAGCQDWIHTAIPFTTLRWVAIVTECVLHDAIPVVTGGNAEKCEECHAEVFEMGMLAQSIAGMLFGTFCEQS